MTRPGVLALLLLGGCASSGAVSAVTVRHRPGLAEGRWVLLPLMNYSDAPRADEGARAILSTLLRARGIKTLAEAPPATTPDPPMPDLDGRLRLEGAIAWGKKEKLAIGITGSVNEWRYRASDGVPAVGISLRVVDIQSGEELWTATGARSGSAGGTVSGTAQRLLQELLEGLEAR